MTIHLILSTNYLTSTAMTLMSVVACFMLNRAYLFSLFSIFTLISFNLLAAPKVIELKIDGAITPNTAAYVRDGFAYAAKVKADAVLISLDTPGGLMQATREIIQTMLGSKIPSIVYVEPPGARAGSAGVFITLAANYAAMAPSTHIGAAHPVSMFGGDIEGEMAKKVENDAAAWARTLALTHNRNADWAEKAVRKSASISSEEALKNKVVDFIAKDRADLFRQISNSKNIKLALNNSQIEVFEMSGRQKLVNFFSDPNLLYILLLLGLLGIFIEFQFPGLILPGLFGVLSLAIVFGVQILPLNWFGVLLILGAMAFFIAEIFFTSFGLLSAGGLALLITGSYLLFDVEGVDALYVNPEIIWTLATSLCLLFLCLAYFVLRAKSQGETSGIACMLGERVKVTKKISENSPGEIILQGAFWQAYSNENIDAGQEAIVERIEGLKAFVKLKE